jgi:uncharacterized membrane protein YphA (DoxX/SURF4 family)
MTWIGWVLTVLPSLVLLFSGSMKLSKSEEVLKGFEHLGYPEYLVLTLAILEIGGTVLYLIPRTAVLGAVVLTGYLGGAIATHVRLGEMQYLAPLVLGVLIWGGLLLRDSRVRALIPVRK